MIHPLLAAYDAQLRTDAETAHALSSTVSGPLRMAVFPGGRGFVSSAALQDADAAQIAALVEMVVEHFGAQEGITEVEWKTRGHDRAPGLVEALTVHGFVAEEPESIMIGEAGVLAQEVAVPDGIRIRRARTDADVWAMEEMQGAVFGDPHWKVRAETTMQRLRADDDVELWIAEADGRIVSAGRLEPVGGTEFAGLWGGATLGDWRGRGIYRALTAERARSALARGKRYLHSDSTEFSRPILERSGLIKVSTTTPYVWTPPAD
ncbi:GNAT family N-acetyltransferase [Microbacterium sp.]|uniref:GNAT family N-acetyltransferase n=1 Tax=Microbacterium sp. TaxID=51671 RepID=UPI002FE18050